MEAKLFQYVRTSAHQARIFLRMSLLLAVYAVALEWAVGEEVIPFERQGGLMISLALAAAGIVSFAVFLYLRGRGKTFRASLTRSRIAVDYPGVPQWTFDLPLDEVEMFGYRRLTSSSSGVSSEVGLFTKDGQFHHISTNYGLNVRKLYKAMLEVRPDVPFPSRVNPHKRKRLKQSED